MNIDEKEKNLIEEIKKLYKKLIHERIDLGPYLKDGRDEQIKILGFAKDCVKKGLTKEKGCESLKTTLYLSLIRKDDRIEYRKERERDIRRDYTKYYDELSRYSIN